MINTNDSKNKIANSAISGTMAGLADAMINYPWTALRIMYQSGQTLKLTPLYLYRGGLQYLLCIIPITAIQSGIDATLKQKTRSEYGQAMSAFLGGIGGALISTPSEHLILTQQKLKVGSVDAAKNLFFKYGYTRLWTGYTPKAFRDGGYSTGMLWGQNTVNNYLSQKLGGRWDISSGIVAGTISAVITQPFDVLSTKKQDTFSPEPLIKMIKNTYCKSGLKGFFPGFLFRTASVISGIIVMGKTKNHVGNYLNNTQVTGITPLDMPEKLVKEVSETIQDQEDQGGENNINMNFSKEYMRKYYSK